MIDTGRRRVLAGKPASFTARRMSLRQKYVSICFN
jgi:hypothetical protein